MSSEQAPLELNLEGTEEYIPLLEGPGGSPRTRGMRSGRVRLEPGKEIGVHSTGNHEEIVLFLEGAGTVTRIGNSPVHVEAGQAVYVPPHTEHNVTNDGDVALKYAFVVAPVIELDAERS